MRTQDFYGCSTRAMLNCTKGELCRRNVCCLPVLLVIIIIIKSYIL